MNAQNGVAAVGGVRNERCGNRIESPRWDGHAPAKSGEVDHRTEWQEPVFHACMQKPLELILARQLAESLSVAVFLVDPQGRLVFYNEPAGEVLGMRFEETGELPMEEWSTEFKPVDAAGRALMPDDLPLVVALRGNRPAHARFWVRGHDQVRREIQVTAIPLRGPGQQVVGAAAFFWEERLE